MFPIEYRPDDDRPAELRRAAARNRAESRLRAEVDAVPDRAGTAIARTTTPAPRPRIRLAARLRDVSPTRLRPS